ncbi:MAG: CotH kinase family protein [Bacteroidales bacterium]|nr:CotH kinase family protein [Bacteroidales bacterium]
MYRSIIFTLSALFFTIQFSLAQGNFPDNGELYVDTIVPRIDITINPDTLAWLYQTENLESDIEFSASFVFDNGQVHDSIYPVGFRLRGNTSRKSAKKSFKVSFNRFTDGGKYYGVEKLNLNGEHNDPSIMRSKISWDILRKMNIPAPRSNHVRVYINGTYYGLYLSVEHIDEEFVKSRFNYNDGNLYKCLYPADLNYLGSDPDLYKLMSGDRPVYELKTNEEANDYSDLANFINILNNTSNADLPCKLDSVFNVYDYIKVMAFDVLSGNWDGYIYNKNNFYLYHNLTTGKLEYIPYDLDNTYGIDWFNVDWGTRNMYEWQQGSGDRPLYEKLIQNQEFRDQYTYYMKQLVEQTLNFDSLKTIVEKRRDMIAPYVANDPYYPLDYGYTMTDFYNSYNEATGAHVKYGIFPYLETRINSIKQQLESTHMQPVIKYIAHQRTSATELWVKAHVDVDSMPATVKINYTVQGQSKTEAPMYDDGLHNDGTAGDNVYGGVIDNIPENASLTYQISATDDRQLESIRPCTPVYVPQAGGSDAKLFINEFMADNDNVVADEHGDYDDWIEIYNGGDQTYWLGDKYLTDNLTKPNKWQMPDVYIQPGQFLVFWADDEEDQGIYHTNFKLSKDGEEIGLFDVNLSTIDSYTFGAQQTDVSEGRLPDGGSAWTFFTQPTPGASNLTTAVPYVLNRNEVLAYPNPAQNTVIRLSKPCDFKVYDMLGRQVSEQKNSNQIDARNYKSGVYFVVLGNGQRLKILVQ